MILVPSTVGVETPGRGVVRLKRPQGTWPGDPIRVPARTAEKAESRKCSIQSDPLRFHTHEGYTEDETMNHSR